MTSSTTPSRKPRQLPFRSLPFWRQAQNTGTFWTAPSANCSSPLHATQRHRKSWSFTARNRTAASGQCRSRSSPAQHTTTSRDSQSFKDTMEHNTLQGVIFDLDGTLLDSTGMWRQVDGRLMAHYGKEVPPDLSETVQRMSIEEFSQFFVEEFDLPVTPEQIAQQVADMVAEEYREKLQLHPLRRCHGDLRRTGRGGAATAARLGTAPVPAHGTGCRHTQDPAEDLSAGGAETAPGQTADRRGGGLAPRTGRRKKRRIFHHRHC